MAMQTEIRYINAYVSGTAAPQPERKPQKHSMAQLPKIKKQPRYVIPVDVVALSGILAAVVLTVMLVVGLVQMNQAQQQAKMYREYAISVQEQNAALKDTYTSSFDLEEVREIAITMGMVPAEEVTHLQMESFEPQQVQEVTAWESFWTFLVGLFA